METKQSFSGEGGSGGEEGLGRGLEVRIVGFEFLFGPGEAQGTGAALLHAMEDGADAAGTGISAEPL